MTGSESDAEPTPRTESGDDQVAFRDRIAVGRDRIRTDRRDRGIWLIAATLAGLALAWVHWIGLMVGGALVALAAPTVRWAPLYGLGFGVVVLGAFAASHAGSLEAIVAMQPIVYVTAGAALGLPALGSLVRGLE